MPSDYLLPPPPPLPPREPNLPPRARPPRPPPRAGAFVSRFFAFALGASSNNNVSNARASGKMTYLILFPLMVNWSNWTGVAPRYGVILTDFNWVFIETSTPTMVPCTMLPFLSSIVTVSWLNFMRNLQRTPILSLAKIEWSDNRISGFNRRITRICLCIWSCRILGRQPSLVCNGVRGPFSCPANSCRFCGRGSVYSRPRALVYKRAGGGAGM